MPALSLNDQREWLRSVFDLLPCPALLIEDGTGRVLFANEAARRGPIAPPFGGDGGTDGAFATDHQGVPIPPDEWPLRRAARGERLDGLSLNWHTPQGRSTFVVSSGTVPAMEGQPRQALLTYQDATRLTATEEELRRAVRVRDEFFSFATHELKDPLASLLLSVEVLGRTAERRGSVPMDFLRERLELCKRQGERLARMIDNLLDVSRIANGRLLLDLEALDLRDLVEEVIGRFQDQAREAGVPLVLVPCGPTIGYFDRVQLEHAVGNLVSNALKYGAGRPVTLRVLADDATVALEVEDRGIGIAEADHGRIFERFERATDGHRDKSLGLGLSIVRAVAEAHGGTVGVRSAPGRGSTFTINLPRKRLNRVDLPAASADGSTD